MMSHREISYDRIADVPLHYDRGARGYGTTGEPRTFASTKKLKVALDRCFASLFEAWRLGRPDILLTAGTLGDGRNAHGQGLAFDLDGFVFGKRVFRMDSYPRNRQLYVALNAHLFGFFTQVLSWHCPGHRDHFHVDFNFSARYRPESNAQTFFVQAAIVHVVGIPLGGTGVEKDGIDGIYGPGTRAGLDKAIGVLGLKGADLRVSASWKAFLEAVKAKGFAAAPDFKA